MEELPIALVTSWTANTLHAKCPFCTGYHGHGIGSLPRTMQSRWQNCYGDCGREYRILYPDEEHDLNLLLGWELDKEQGKIYTVDSEGRVGNPTYYGYQNRTGPREYDAVEGFPTENELDGWNLSRAFKIRDVSSVLVDVCDELISRRKSSTRKSYKSECVVKDIRHLQILIAEYAKARIIVVRTGSERRNRTIGSNRLIEQPQFHHSIPTNPTQSHITDETHNPESQEPPITSATLNRGPKYPLITATNNSSSSTTPDTLNTTIWSQKAQQLILTLHLQVPKDCVTHVETLLLTYYLDRHCIWDGDGSDAQALRVGLGPDEERLGDVLPGRPVAVILVEGEERCVGCEGFLGGVCGLVGVRIVCVGG